MQNKIRKWMVWIAGIGLFCLIILFYSKYLTFDRLKQDREWFLGLVHHYPVSSVGIYIALCTIVIGVGLPVIVPITLIAGFLFGAIAGTVYTTIGATLGVVLLFTALSYLIHNTVYPDSWKFVWWDRSAKKFAALLHEYGYSYLLTMHWMTVIPFSVVALAAAFADVPLGVVIWTTIVGSIPMIFIYALAGKELGTINNPTDIFSWKVMVSFGLLALLALVPVVIQRLRRPKN